MNLKKTIVSAGALAAVVATNVAHAAADVGITSTVTNAKENIEAIKNGTIEIAGVMFLLFIALLGYRKFKSGAK